MFHHSNHDRRVTHVLEFSLLTVAVLVAATSCNKTQPPPQPKVADTSRVSAGNEHTTVAAQKALPKLLDLGAGKCIPCKQMAPILEELKTEFAGVLDVEFIDVWQNPTVGKIYKLNMIPTQIFYDNTGTELFRHEGFFSKQDILAKWQELGIELATPSQG